MSTTIMAQCWPLQMPPTQKAVLISLADNANDQGSCWPSIPTICQRTCFSERAVQNAIQWLEAHGVVLADRSNGRHTRYMLTPAAYAPPQHVHPRTSDTTAADAPAQQVRQTPAGDAPHPRSRCTQPPQQVPSNRQEPSSNRQGNRQSARVTPATTADRFAEFWTAYPNKTAKPQCLAKWKAKHLDAIADRILADVAKKAAQDRRWLDGFVPNPLTYLNQERWNDPVQPRPGAAGSPPTTGKQTALEQSNRSAAEAWARGQGSADPIEEESHAGV